MCQRRDDLDDDRCRSLRFSVIDLHQDFGKPHDGNWVSLAESMDKMGLCISPWKLILPYLGV